MGRSYEKSPDYRNFELSFGSFCGRGPKMCEHLKRKVDVMQSTGSKMEREGAQLLVSKAGDVSCGGQEIVVE